MVSVLLNVRAGVVVVPTIVVGGAIIDAINNVWLHVMYTVFLTVAILVSRIPQQE